MKKIGRKATRPSNVNMVGIHGDKKKAIGEIEQLPIKIQSVDIPINVVISEAQGYDVLIGNDWFTKYGASLSWPKNELIFQRSAKIYTQPACCWKKLPLIVTEDSEDEYEEELQPYYQLDLQDTEIIANEEILQIDNEQYSWEYLEWIQQGNDCPDEWYDNDCYFYKKEDQIRAQLEILIPTEARRVEKEQDTGI